MSDRLVTLGDLVDQAVAAGLRDIYKLIPAKVVKYDASTQKVDCKILIKNITRGEEDDREVMSAPVVPNVPVEFLGAGGFRITCPISDGTLQIDGQTVKATTGCLQFSHRSLDKWLSGDGSEVDPEFDHDHALGDAVFRPGLMPFGAPWGSCPTDHMTMGSDAGVQIHFHNQTIAAGDEAGNDFVALAAKTNKAISDFYTILNNVFGASSAPIVTPAPTVADPVYVAVKAAIAALVVSGAPWPPDDVATTQFKAK
jgi:hypothetical protein